MDKSSFKMSPEELQNYMKAMRSGCGVHRKLKGKGSYTRKNKHKSFEKTS